MSKLEIRDSTGHLDATIEVDDAGWMTIAHVQPGPGMTGIDAELMLGQGTAVELTRWLLERYPEAREPRKE